MKKYFFILALLMICGNAFGQIGVGLLVKLASGQ